MLFLLLLLVTAGLSVDPDPDPVALEAALQKEYEELFGKPPETTTGKTQSLFGNTVNRGSDSTEVVKCTRTDNKPGVCVMYYQCDPETRKVITDGATIFDVRISSCPNMYHVCCLEPDVDTTAAKPPDFPALPTQPPGDTTPKPKKVPGQAPNLGFNSCGHSHLGTGFRLGESEEANKSEFLEFPWVVALLKHPSPQGAWSQQDYLGGGSLIHPSVIVTSAHKVSNVTADKLKVRAGEFDTQTQKEIYKHQERFAKKIIIHENFYRPSILNSIALIILKEPFDLSVPNIGLACIGYQMPLQGTRCWGVGWGRRKFDDEQYATELKKVSLPIFGRQACQDALRGTRLGRFFILHESLTCAGGEKNSDTCDGDGGAPLICPLGKPQDLRYAIFGATAYGISCGKEGVPGVYVHLTHFRAWIGQRMAGEGFDDTSYSYDINT